MMDENVCITSYGKMVKFTHCGAPDTKWEYVREVDETFRFLISNFFSYILNGLLP